MGSLSTGRLARRRWSAAGALSTAVSFSAGPVVRIRFPPAKSRSRTSRAKSNPLSPGTEGSNPALSSSESDELPPEQERVAGSQRRSLRRPSSNEARHSGDAVLGLATSSIWSAARPEGRWALRPPENLVDGGGATPKLVRARPVRHQDAGIDKPPPNVDRWQAVGGYKLDSPRLGQG